MRGAASMISALFAVLVGSIGAQSPPPPIWQGVYTDAQADRGKETYQSACVRCHGGDLAGTTAPALKGDHFMNTWGGGSLSRLFEKIRDTMPPNFGTIVADSAKLDIVAYILQSNGYPAGPRALVAGNAMATIQILRKGEQPKAQNFSLVQSVGCLARSDSGQWLITRSSEPTVTTANTPSEDALAAAASAPLGTESYALLNAMPFKPAEYVGQKVEARGLVYRDGGDALITVTSLRTVSPTGCS